MMASGRLVPQEFELKDVEKFLQDRGELYKWIYKIPVSFYARLHKKIVRMGIVKEKKI